jgi:hypothetical protein
MQLKQPPFVRRTFLLYRLNPKRETIMSEDNTAGTEKKFLPLLVYLALSIGVGVFAIVAFVAKPDILKPLWVVTSPPFMLSQILLSIVGIKLKSEIAINIVLSTFAMVYYLIVLYPFYRLASPAKNPNPASQTRHKVLAAVFSITHVAMTLILAALIKA